MERIAAGECRAEGRTISGVAMPYGERSASHAERFQAGAFGPLSSPGRTRWLNLRHDPLAVLAYQGAGLVFEDSPEGLRLRADLPEIPAADLALEGLRAGRLGGLSVEFLAERESRQGDTRVIEQATLYGVGLVSRPAYAGATAELREIRQRGKMRARIPKGAALQCECCGPEVAEVVFEQTIDVSPDALAVAGNYQRPLASRTRGTLKVEATAGALLVDIDLPDGVVGEEILAAHLAAGVIVRPIVDMERSQFTDTDGVRHYQRAEVKGFTVGATDKRAGWPEPEIDGEERSAWDFMPPEGDETEVGKGVAGLRALESRRVAAWL